MDGKRGKAVTIFFMTAALIVILVFGLTQVRKRGETRQLRQAPPPSAGAPRVVLGFLAQEPHVKGETSLIVHKVNPGGAAEKGGLRPGDRLLGLAGYSIKTHDDMAGALGTAPPGKPISLLVARDGKEIELTLIPGAPVSRSRSLR